MTDNDIKEIQRAIKAYYRDPDNDHTRIPHPHDVAIEIVDNEELAITVALLGYRQIGEFLP